MTLSTLLTFNSAAPASQILDRLEYLIGLVESGPTPSYGTDGHSVNGNRVDLAMSMPNLSGSVPHDNTSLHESAAADCPESDSAEVTREAYFGSSQDILDWPIFEGRYDRRWIEALIFDPTLSFDGLSGPCTSPRVTDDSIRDRYEDPRQASGVGAGVREDDVPNLVESFLVNVHVKNPIFDPEYLRRMAKGVVENGFDWKAPSCLVVRTHYFAASYC